MQLRDYQTKALNQIKTEYLKGNKKTLLHLATGAGKTVIFCTLLKAVHGKGKRAIMVVRGRKLVDQASQRLIRENVEHGVLMANHWNYRPYHRIQVCSIDTLRSRKLKPDADLIVIDEAHLATSDSYIEFLEQYPDAFFLPVTATPYTEKPITHLAMTAIKPISMQELIDLGHLVPPRYFAPVIPDTSDIKISQSTKDYQQDELGELMSDKTLIGDLVFNWKKFGENRPTLCFAVTVDHSKAIAQQFNEAGIPWEHHDAHSTDGERNEAINKLKTGEIKGITNVGIFCTGVDIPHISCILFARPTKSQILYIQQAGRGTRPSNGKRDFLILDHAGNIIRHGFITNEPEACLDGKPKKLKSLPNPKICPECFLAFMGTHCPDCGQTEKAPREFMNIDGELREVTNEPFEARVNRFIKEHKKIASTRGYKRGWIYYRLVDEFGQDVADHFMPKRKVPDWVKLQNRLEG